MDFGKDSRIVSLFPFIEKSIRQFDEQNKFLKKIILTGKICAVDKAANLFAFTEKTVGTFTELRNRLIPLLVEKNLEKYTHQIRSKAQTSIDILTRNLFERTADVGFLATDSVLIDFLLGSVADTSMRSRLNDYVDKYSVYDEIIVIDASGMTRLNIHKTNSPAPFSSDPIFTDALKTDGYVEAYHHSDLYPDNDRTLMFAQKIVHERRTLGVLVLCFRFRDEMERIFGALVTDPAEKIVFADGKDVIASSSESTFQPPKTLHDGTGFHNGLLSTTTKTKGYEGYFGAGWSSIASIDVRKYVKNESTLPDTIKCTLENDIQSIISNADDVIEDLSDVIINGELIASKERVYVLTPVLDNLRSVSSSILDTIKASVANLESAILHGLVYEAKSASMLAIDIMDRNLYERANDCRWWALTPEFSHQLSTHAPDSSVLGEILSYINSLYTVYTNLLVYNGSGIIVASSSDSSLIGKIISGNAVSKTLVNNRQQNYFVSPFEPTPFYASRPTYLYCASILQKDKAVGGIAIVFDAESQFKAILADSFPASRKGFGCFIDRKGIIISSTRPEHVPGTLLSIGDDILKYNSDAPDYRIIRFDDLHYLVGIALSKGYREYKVQDKYVNDVIALTFIEL